MTNNLERDNYWAANAIHCIKKFFEFHTDKGLVRPGIKGTLSQQLVLKDHRIFSNVAVKYAIYA
jgi:hypothetical protein